MTSSQQFQSTVGWRTYLDPTTHPRVKRFLKKNGAEVFSQIVANIQMAMDKQYNQFVLVAHPNVSSVIVINISEYNGLLDHCLGWFTAQEDYKQCDIITKLQSRLPPKQNTLRLN